MNPKFYELSKEKQNSIINGALSVFAKYDYKKASTEEIAKASGISKALIFHYFGSKKELYLFLCRYVIKFLAEGMSELYKSSETDFFEIMKAAQDCKMKILSVYPDIILFSMKVYFEENEVVKPDIAHIFANIASDNTTWFLDRVDKQKFREGASVEKVLNVVLWMAEGFMRTRSPEELKNLDDLNEEYLSYLEFLKRQFYKKEYL